MPRTGLVALVGRPNAGKSTLLNALVGQKLSIVSDKAQTTRNCILGVLTETRGQILFSDTPGIHKPGYNLNRRMLAGVHDSLRQVDLVLHLVDASIRTGAGERYAMEMVRRARKPSLLVLNKIDCIPKNDLLPLIAAYAREEMYLEIIPISALRGEQLDILLEQIFKHLPEGEPLYPPEYLTDRSERFLVAELIREKVLDHTHAELPYATAVRIDRFDEVERAATGLTRIYATIVVERESQKGIVVGHGGEKIKAIGTEARREIEALLESRVFLDLQVKVIEEWRDRDRVLDNIGIEHER